MDHFSTENLTAERLNENHLADLVALHLDADVSRYLGGVRPAERTKTYLDANISHWDQYGFGMWVLRTKDGAFAGRAGIRHILVDDTDEVEIAYAFKREFWGRGLASETATSSSDARSVTAKTSSSTAASGERRPDDHSVRSRTTDCGREARNNTTQTHSRTMSLNRNSPVRFHAIGSDERLHLTTPGVVKKNDQVIAKVTMPINEPSADETGLKLPAASSAAITNSTTPRT
jgi:hypothetical protein